MEASKNFDLIFPSTSLQKILKTIRSNTKSTDSSKELISQMLICLVGTSTWLMQK
jgi:hypothetical protein